MPKTTAEETNVFKSHGHRAIVDISQLLCARRKAIDKDLLFSVLQNVAMDLSTPRELIFTRHKGSLISDQRYVGCKQDLFMSI